MILNMKNEMGGPPEPCVCQIQMSGPQILQDCRTDQGRTRFMHNNKNKHHQHPQTNNNQTRATPMSVSCRRRFEIRKQP